MFKKFLFLGAAALAMTATSTIAADASRARLMIPVQVTLSGEDLDGYESPSPSGYNLQYVHSSGFGIGYTSTSFTATDSTSNDSEITFKDTTFVDLSYTIGSEMTAQFVLGSVIGQGPVTGPGFESENTSNSGTAFGINGGQDFGGFEALIGYRSESVNAAYGGSERAYNRTLIMAGVGITF